MTDRSDHTLIETDELVIYELPANTREHAVETAADWHHKGENVGVCRGGARTECGTFVVLVEKTAASHL